VFTRHLETLARIALLVTLGGAGPYTSTAIAQAADSARFGHSDSLTFVAVSAGGGHTCAVTLRGVAYCWGFGRHGELGNGDTASSPVPVPVAGGYRFVTVAAGRFHACGLTADSAAYCWGGNWQGQVGTDSLGESCTDRKEPQKPFACSLHPRPVAGGHHFAALSVGAVHTCGLSGNGAAYCWGYNGSSVLGSEAAPASATVPVPVAGAMRFISVSAGLNHSCGVTVGGQLSCWGLNKDNQLGNDSLDRSKSPVMIASDVTFLSVTAGGQHTCAIAADTTAYCWGDFEHGRLGIGESLGQHLKDKKHQSSPAPVDGRMTFRSLSAGGAHTCGVTTGGKAYCWGDNLEGRLGTGGSFLTARQWNTKPSAVEGDLKFTMISAGEYHSCGVTTEGAVYCWGGNREGQLGNGTTKGKGKPVHVGSAPAAPAPDSSGAR
jgi:alpha-tubulin suppressor-like RCC1 family protein